MNFKIEESPIFRTNSVLDIYVSLPCTLRELYFGCNKLITFIRKVRIQGQSMSMLVEREIQIPRGFKYRKRIVFEGEGEFDDQVKDRNSSTGDLVVIVEPVKEKDLKLERVGPDQEHLKYVHTLTLREALTSELVSFQIDLFGVKKLDVRIDNSQNLITPDYFHV